MGPAGVLLFFFVIILAISSEPGTTGKSVRIPFQIVDSNTTTSVLRRRSNSNIPLKSFQEKLWKGTIGFGNPPQQVDVIFDTGSADTWVVDALCDNCGDLPKYDLSKSQGAEDLEDEFQIEYGDGDIIEGTWTRDIVTFGTVAIPKQAFARAKHVPDSLVGNGYSGLVGLGFSTDYEDMSPVIEMLQEEPLDSPVISVRFVKNNPDQAGEIVFGAIENQYISGDIIYNSLTRSFGQVTDWAIRVNAVQIKDKRMGQRGISAIMDTGSSTIGVTFEVANFLYDGTGAERVDGQWYVPDPFPSDVTFAFDQGEFAVPADDMVLRNEPKQHDKYPGAIQEYIINDKWVIGQPFIKNYYVVFNYGAQNLGIAKRSS